MEQSEYKSKDLAVKIEDDDESKANKSFFLGNQNADGNISQHQSPIFNTRIV